MDLALCDSLGLDCRALRYICVKSTGHFRDGFQPIAGSIFNVDHGETLFTMDYAKLTQGFTRLGPPVRTSRAPGGPTV
jgi:microcystin degradation protein MlrC